MPRMMRGGMPQKVNDAKKALQRLFSYLKSFMPWIIVSMALIIVATIFRLAGPSQLAKITDINFKKRSEL